VVLIITTRILKSELISATIKSTIHVFGFHIRNSVVCMFLCLLSWPLLSLVRCFINGVGKLIYHQSMVN